jgi:hypothetical protein
MSRKIKFLWLIQVVVTILYLTCTFIVDLNMTLLNFSSGVSLAIIVTLTCLGVFSSFLLMFLDRARRFVCVGLLIVYLVMSLPAFL